MNSEPGREKSIDFVDEGPKRQEKTQGLKLNIELIYKNIRPHKIEQKTKDKN